MKEINVFQVVTNSDLNAGSGRPVIVGNFTNESVAEQASKKKGVQGTSADVKRNVIKVFDTIEEYMEETGNEVQGITDVIRRNALNKLDDTEKRLLGLDENNY